jgi:hypothetical protein
MTIDKNGEATVFCSSNCISASIKQRRKPEMLYPAHACPCSSSEWLPGYAEPFICKYKSIFECSKTQKHSIYSMHLKFERYVNGECLASQWYGEYAIEEGERRLNKSWKRRCG